MKGSEHGNEHGNLPAYETDLKEMSNDSQNNKAESSSEYNEDDMSSSQGKRGNNSGNKRGGNLMKPKRGGVLSGKDKKVANNQATGVNKQLSVKAQTNIDISQVNDKD